MVSSCPTTWRLRPVSSSVASLPVLFGSSTLVLIISLLLLDSRCPAIGAFTPPQMWRQLLFRVEHAPLDRTDRNGLGCRDFVVFPFLDKAQRQRFLLPRVEERHPMLKFKRRRGGGRLD